MDNNGYIKLYRSMLDWEWFTDKNTLLVFIYILLNANWEDSRYRGHEIPKGSLVTGVPKMAKTLNLSERNVRTALNHLKSTGEVSIKVTNKFSIVTIANWEKYQCNEMKATSKMTDKVSFNRHSTDIQLTTEEEYKNIRNKEYYIWAQEKYNSICTKLKPCKSITKPRMDALDNLFDAFNRDEIEHVFKKVNDNTWLTGQNETKWKADFDWIIDITHFVRIQEGRYDEIHVKGFDANKGLSKNNYDFSALEKETKERRN